jgi:hypothetical protein
MVIIMFMCSTVVIVAATCKQMFVGFEVLTAVSILMMEAARTSETLVNFYQTARCYNPEDSHLHTNVCRI